MKQGGNFKANLKYNPHPEQHPLPLAEDDSGMERYIRAKWEKKAFMEREEREKESPKPQATRQLQVSATPVRSSSVPVVYQGSNHGPALHRLRDMGFHDQERNRQVLTQTQGDVDAAIEILLRLPGARAPSSQPSSANISDEHKLVQLWNLGFHDETKNKEALRRTGGNVDVAAAIMVEEKKQQQQSQTSTPSPTRDTFDRLESGGRTQTNQERQNHKLPGAQLSQQQQLVNTSAAVSSANNPFYSQQGQGLSNQGAFSQPSVLFDTNPYASAGLQQQQQSFQNNTGNPLNSSILSLYNNPAQQQQTQQSIVASPFGQSQTTFSPLATLTPTTPGSNGGGYFSVSANGGVSTAMTGNITPNGSPFSGLSIQQQQPQLTGFNGLVTSQQQQPQLTGFNGLAGQPFGSAGGSPGFSGIGMQQTGFGRVGYYLWLRLGAFSNFKSGRRKCAFDVGSEENREKDISQQLSTATRTNTLPSNTPTNNFQYASPNTSNPGWNTVNNSLGTPTGSNNPFGTSATAGLGGFSIPNSMNAAATGQFNGLNTSMQPNSGVAPVFGQSATTPTSNNPWASSQGGPFF
ncbi:hypothetical protein BC937DRAFT_90672 [Endogone sp. FLAS-F59071]|nr:hypothetical protein BC937DRAFT_90672 [Endogone sp. FLAS-F59071]|eukprot:RUS21999.1 hypothetical protein BC937DRAFT_90672 [Endogone sp. FLAS-F59071]